MIIFCVTIFVAVLLAHTISFSALLVCIDNVAACYFLLFISLISLFNFQFQPILILNYLSTIILLIMSIDFRMRLALC